MRQRMDSGLEQNLVDINIAEPGQERLIQQQSFHPRLPLAKARGNSSRPISSGSGPSFFDARVAPFDAAELARIVIEQDAIVQREDAVGVRALDARGQQLSGHTQMHSEFARVQPDHDKLAAPRNRFNAPSGHLPRELRPVAGSHKSGSESRGENGAPN